MSGATTLDAARARLADGDLAGALAAIDGVLRERADNAPALALRARLLRLRGDLEGAAACAARALEADEANPEALLESAALAREQRDFERALDLLSELVFHHPGDARAQLEIGRLHRLQNRLDEALESLRGAVASDPGLADAHIEIGCILNLRNDHEGAMAAFERGLELDPSSVLAQHNLGYVLGKLEHYERALELLEKLCARVPIRQAGTWLNLALALAAHGETRRAGEIYDRILEVEPNHVTARWNRAHFLLAERDFERGWRDYEWRFLSESLGPPRLIPFAPWRGEPLEGRTLLVSAEQGLGDQIMFASCIDELAARAGRVVLECTTRLEALFRRSFPGVQVIGSRQELEPAWLREVGEVDYHAAAGSLPRYLRNRIEDFPRHAGYLEADPERVRYWKSRLDALGSGLKVGLSWRGGTHSTRRRLRTLRLDDLRGLVATPGCRFVNLQYDDCAEELAAFRAGTGLEVAHWPEAIRDYDETAALCSALDLTVSVCTSVIHLNGALGRPVWIMVPSAPEWRYGFRGEGLPWYPSARLFRQAERGSWEPVVEAVTASLRARVRESVS